MTLITGIGAPTPFQSRQPEAQPQDPPQDQTESSAPREASQPPPASQAQSQSASNGSGTNTQTTPVEPPRQNTDTAAANTTTAARLDTAASDAAAKTVFEKKAIPLPVQDFLPGPRDETGAQLSEEALRAQAQAVADAQRTESLIANVASVSSTPPKGEALNLVVPLPEAGQTSAQARAEPDPA